MKYYNANAKIDLLNILIWQVYFDHNFNIIFCILYYMLNYLDIFNNANGIPYPNLPILAFAFYCAENN